MKFHTKAKYIKYTRAELERYTADVSSCVQKIHAREHFGISMAGLQNLRETISNILDRKIGRFDQNHSGIILDIRNTKVLNTPSVIRHDSADLHLDIESDFYVFQPRIGSILSGVVKHISQANISVIIYRVFNVAVKFTSKNVSHRIKVNKEIKIRVMNFELDNRVPEIQAELVTDEKTEENDGDSGISTEDIVPMKIKQEPDSDDQAGTSSSQESKGNVLNGEDKSNRRQSILVRKNKGQQTKKHVSFNDTIVDVKSEPESDNGERTPTKKKKKRLRSPSPPPKLDETGFNVFEQQIERDLQSTIIGVDTVTIKQEKSPSKSHKKRKRGREDDDEEVQVLKKKSRKDDGDSELVSIKQEPEESSSTMETDGKKKKKKKNKERGDAKMSNDSFTQSTSDKVPKIKKEKI